MCFQSYIIYCVVIFLIGNVAANGLNIERNLIQDSLLKLGLTEETCKFSYHYGVASETRSSFDGVASILNLNDSCRPQIQQLEANESIRFQFFKECVAQRVEKITLTTHTVFDEKSPIQPSSLFNLKHLTWRLGRHPMNKLLSNYKHLESLTLELYFNTVDEYSKLDAVQHEQLKELHILVEAEPDDNSIKINKAFLSKLRNLEVFEFNGGFNHENVHLNIDKQMFQGLPKLSKIILINGNFTIESDHFQNLTNLKSLSFTNKFEFGYKILSSETLQNNLEHLVIAPLYSYQKDDEVKKYLATYKKLQIIETPKEYQFRFFKDNITAFICVQKKRVCKFISGINNVTCPHFCDCTLDRLEMRFDISCQHYYVKIPVLPIPIIGNTTLKFNNNNITLLPNNTVDGYAEARELHLLNNQLQNLTVDQLPTNLTYLDLRNNRLEKLDEQVLEFLWNRSSSLSIKLSGNPWICDCNAKNLIEFVLKYPKIEDRDGIECSDPDIGQMLSIGYDVCDPYANYVKGIIIIGVTLALIILILVFCYYKQNILMWLYENGYCLRWISRPEPEESIPMKHDAFLAFSHVDLEYAEEFVEALENGAKKYKVCYYHRDWLPGESIPECILSTIEESKRTIILLTPDFINSSWGRFEFRSAIKANSLHNKKRLIVILYPNVDINNLDSDLKSYLKYNIYLNRDDSQFWRKLMFAMPHNHMLRNVSEVAL